MNHPLAETLLTRAQRRELIACAFHALQDQSAGAALDPDAVGGLAVMPDDELLALVRRQEAGGYERSVEVLTRLGLSQRRTRVFMPVSCEAGGKEARFVAVSLSAETVAQYMSDYLRVSDLPQFASVSLSLEHPVEFFPAEPQTQCLGTALVRHDLRERSQVAFVFEESRPGKLDRRVATGVVRLEDLHEAVRTAVLRGTPAYIHCTPGEVLAAQQDAPSAQRPRERQRP